MDYKFIIAWICFFNLVNYYIWFNANNYRNTQLDYTMEKLEKIIDSFHDILEAVLPIVYVIIFINIFTQIITK